jgi:hypothetical protein
MKKLYFLLILFTISLSVHSQFINVQSGMNLSKLRYYFTNYKVGISEYVGVEYLETKFFNLNSNIGYISKGGVYKLTRYGADNTNYSGYESRTQNFGYASLNTTFEFRYRFANKFVPFIGLGPMLELLVTNNKMYKDLDMGFKIPQPWSFGAIATGGAKYYISKFQVGALASYLWDMNKVDRSTKGNVTSKTFSFQLILGYRFK